MMKLPLMFGQIWIHRNFSLVAESTIFLKYAVVLCQTAGVRSPSCSTGRFEKLFSEAESTEYVESTVAPGITGN